MPAQIKEKLPANKQRNLKILIGTIVIVAGLVILLITTTSNSLQYFLTVEELLANPASFETKNVRISGAVLGDSIQLDEQNGTVRFTIANIPGDHKVIRQMGGMEKVLKEAVSNSGTKKLNILYHGAKPDLLKNESQAILTGKMVNENTFEADEILLKCPSKYQSATN